MKKKTTKEYICEVSIKNPSVRVLGEYTGNDKSILHECKICGHTWLARPHNVLNGTKCPACQMKAGKYRAKKTHKEYVLELARVNPDIICLGEYNGTNTKIPHKCLKCGKKWDAQPANILAGTSCPVCSYRNMGKMKTRTHQEYIDELEKVNPNIFPLEKYVCSKEKILHLCKVCGNQFMLDPNHAIQGVGCSLCNNAKRIQRRFKSHEDYVSQCQETSPKVKIIGRYNGSRNVVDAECLVCGHHWSPIADSILHGHGCPACADNATGNRCRKTNEEYLLELKNQFPHISAKEEYKGSSVSILHHCDKCHNDFYARPSNVLSYGCGKCSKLYSGEDRIKRFLECNNIQYIHNYRFQDLKGQRNPLSYDFYLPSRNCLIEFQGEQHERPVDYFGGEDHFNKQQKHDFMKRKYAFDHNIRLIEIWYYEFDEIENILQDKLNIESVETVIEA